MPSSSRSSVAIASCLCVLQALLAGPAGAAPWGGVASANGNGEAPTARAHHESGRAHVRSGRYDSAIAEYRKAYELRADPSYLLDIAEAYKALGVAERAVFFYRRYLTTHPSPPNRPEVEAQIALLDPGGAVPAPVQAGVLPVPRPTPDRAGARRGDLHLGATRVIGESESSLAGRWWFWAAVGTLAAAGATLAILAASQREEDAPATALGNVKIF